MNELKPCPFCGKEPTVHTTYYPDFHTPGNDLYVTDVYCVECDYVMEKHGRTEERAQEKASKCWNTRNNPNWIEDMKAWALDWLEGADEPEFTLFYQMHRSLCEYERELDR